MSKQATMEDILKIETLLEETDITSQMARTLHAENRDRAWQRYIKQTAITTSHLYQRSR
jgi:hypothetical protein